MSARGGVLAIDHGAKRTGFAVCDGLRISKHALPAWHGSPEGEEILKHIDRLLEERTVGTLLLGMPNLADGSMSERSRIVKTFQARLAQRFPALAIVAHDEHLSTKAAEDRLRDAGYHGARRKERTDSWSALVILEDWIASGEPH